MKPEWLKSKIVGKNFAKIKQSLANVHTVCLESCCPNREECFSLGNATVMILGNICTRNCKFCGCKNGTPGPVDSNEIEGISNFVEKMSIKYLVITCVTRDDLADYGGRHFSNITKYLKKRFVDLKIELLISDMGGSTSNLDIVLGSNADIIGHNIETPAAITPLIRDKATYENSISVLKYLSSFVETKSSLILGLGETEQEVLQTLYDLKNNGVSIVTIGQYLRPNTNCYPVKKYYTPSEFLKFKEFSQNLGLKVMSGPLVRSSYHANLL